LLDVIAYLRSHPEQFFVFPDFTFLYGVLEVPSPQPLLWFHRGLTYSEEYSEALDREIVASLEARGVKTVVVETDSFGGTLKRFSDFPQLRQFIARNFEYDRQIGNFAIYRERALLGKTPPPTIVR